MIGSLRNSKSRLSVQLIRRDKASSNIKVAPEVSPLVFELWMINENVQSVCVMRQLPHVLILFTAYSTQVCVNIIQSLSLNFILLIFKRSSWS